MKIFVLLIIIQMVILSCNNENEMKRHKIEDETTYSFNTKDKEMNDAITEAIQTLDEFDNALKSNNPDFKKFSLKVRFQIDSGSEHIWVIDIKKENDSY